MCAVTEWRGSCLFTTAQVRRTCLLRSKGGGLDSATFMRTVAEGLAFTASTGTPVVGVI